MPVPSEVTLEASFTSTDEFISRTAKSSCSTCSTSALETNGETSISKWTENTLSMISTPWVTESLDVKTFELTDDTDLSSAFLSFSYSAGTLLSSTTLQPITSTTYGIPSPQVNTDQDTTITILCGGGSMSSSHSIRPLKEQNNRESKLPSGTFSSWTLESFTSSGWYSDSEVVRAKYPWSPSTVFSGTEIYPSSLNSLATRKESRVTLTTTGTLGSKSRQEKGHITPVHYMGMSNRPGENPMLDWTLGKLNGVPSDALNLIVAV